MPLASSTETPLHQINALVNGAKSIAEKAFTAQYHQIQKTPPLSGIARTYQPRDDDGEQLPPESTRVQVVVQNDVFPAIEKALSRLLNLQHLQDVGNTRARADIVVDGHTVFEQVPVTYLLFLEKKLVDLRTVIAALPTLDPSDKWTWDNERGCYVSEPTQTMRTKKVPRNHQVAPATDKHPAQVQVFTEDVPQGVWTTVKLSGAVPVALARTLRERVERLIDSVRTAREQANAVAVPEQDDIAVALFGYVFAGTTSL